MMEFTVKEDTIYRFERRALPNVFPRNLRNIEHKKQWESELLNVILIRNV